MGYLRTHQLELEPTVSANLQRHGKKPWSQFISLENRHLATSEVLDLIDKLLVYDHVNRLTVREALQHPFFDSLRVVDELVSLTFKPAALGIAAQPNGLVTKVAPNSQGALAGVPVGWYLHEVQGVKFSIFLLKSYLASGQQFTITFRKVL